MEKEGFRVKESIIILIALVLFSLFLLHGKPTITGLTILQESYTWDFSNLNDYTYDNNIIIENGEVKLRLITSYNYWIENNIIVYDLIKARYSGDDKLNKLIAIDGNVVNVDKSEKFKLNFSNNLVNGDIISMYIIASDESDIYLCQYDVKNCASPGYGLVHYNGGSGYYNITVINLPISVNGIDIDPVNIKFDYIYATHNEVIEHNDSIVSYPNSSVIETNDFSLANLDSFGMFSTNEELNGQQVKYYYSIDSGQIWVLIEDYNLSSVNSNKIRFKVELLSNGENTPVVKSLTINYNKRLESCDDGVKNQDEVLVDCGGVCGSCNTSNYYEINGSGTISLLKDENYTIKSSDVNLDLKVNDNLINKSLSINVYSDNNLSFSGKNSLNKFVEINAEEISNNISSAVIKVYYNDNNVANIDENSLKIYYYNNGVWEELNSNVNAEENYVYANIEHFSLYGIFGNEKVTTTSSGGGGGSSSGSSGSSKTVTETTKPIETEKKVEICIELWDCEEWSECTNGIKTRSCIDKNNCGTNKNKPVEEESCVEEEKVGFLNRFTGDVVKNLKENKVRGILIIVIVLLIIGYLVYRIIYHKSEKHKRFHRRRR